MDLQKLRGFYWSAQLGSISAAAQMMHISQSAISHQLKSLAKELDVKLYERSGRGIVLTPEGERLVTYARKVVHSVDDLQSEFAEMRGQPRGNVRIAAFRGIATHWLPEITQRFREQHPNVTLVISSRAFDSVILRLVAAGEADLGITTSWNEFRDMDYLECLTCDMFACLPRNHPWAERRQPLTLAELAGQPLVLYEQGTAIRDRLDQVFARHDLHPDVPIAVGGSQALLEYVKIGSGVGIISDLSAGQGHDQDLCTVPVTELFGKLGYGFVLPRGRYLTTAAQAFLTLASAGSTSP